MTLVDGMGQKLHKVKIIDGNPHFAFIIKRVREKNIDISKLSDSERWKLMDELVNEYFGNS